MKLKKGYIHIYTGEGKGKTTAAMGLGVRAAGCGLKVCCLQFFKDRKFHCSEASAIKKLGANFKFKRFDITHPCFKKDCADKLKTGLIKALEETANIIRNGKYDLVILDEILVGVSQGFIKEKAVLDIIMTKPKNTELVMTGRGATKRLIECADYVTHMKEVKHPYNNGTKMRKGIEY